MALFQRRGGGKETELEMAPMIDCVFLLLIFFMVSAIMEPRPHFQPPYRSQKQDTKSPSVRGEKKSLQGKQETSSWRYGVVIDVMERAKQRFSTLEGIEYHIPNN